LVNLFEVELMTSITPMEGDFSAGIPKHRSELLCIFWGDERIPLSSGEKYRDSGEIR
jgi:hypothetical protein